MHDSDRSLPLRATAAQPGRARPMEAHGSRAAAFGDRAPPPGASAETLWRTLWHDSGLGAAITDRDARIISANAPMRAWSTTSSTRNPKSNSAPPAPSSMSIASGQTLGPAPRLGDALPDPLKSDIKRLVMTVVTTGEPMVLDTIIRGVSTRLTMRSIGGDSAEGPLVLCTSADMVSCDPVAAPALSRSVEAPSRDLGVLSELTATETEIARHIAAGYTSAAIGRKLDRSPKTIEWHRSSIRRKLAERGALGELPALFRLAGMELPAPPPSHAQAEHKESRR